MTELSASARRVPALADAADWLARLSGWRRRGVVYAVGVFATLALPPVYFLPALYLSFPALVWVLAGAENRRSAFAIGWWFGFGFFTASLYWIGNALLVFAAKHAWMVPFAALGLPAFLAFYTGLAGLAASFARNHLQRALLLAAAWAAAEWLRGHLFTGFPWNLVGQSWGAFDSLLQIAAIVGIYGVTLFAVASASLPAALVGERNGRRWLLAAISIFLIAAPWIGGSLRLAAAPAPGEQIVAGIGLRIVQAGIPQREKWRRDLRQRNFELHLGLSNENRPDWISHIIWPENAATFFVEERPLERQAIASVLPSGGLLVTGAPRRMRSPLRVWNSVFAIDERGSIVGRYDKFHLVPFGEYVPLRGWLPIDKVTQGAVDYSAGPGPQTLKLPGLPAVSALVCYEAIFPGEVVDRSDPAAWMLNLTNDAWYGVTAGPHQHLAISRVRAVEEGLPMVRAANTGISAVIDPYGRELARLGLTEKGTLDARLPAALAAAPFYAKYGEASFWLAVLLVSVVAIFARRHEG